MNQYPYAKEKLCVVMHELAAGKEDVRSRLLNAFMIFHTLKVDDFPLEFREEWKWIEGQLTKYGPLCDCNGKEILGSAENTMRRIRNSTGKRIAEKIFNIGWELHTNKKYLLG